MLSGRGLVVRHLRKTLASCLSPPSSRSSPFPPFVPSSSLPLSLSPSLPPSLPPSLALSLALSLCLSLSLSLCLSLSLSLYLPLFALQRHVPPELPRFQCTAFSGPLNCLRATGFPLDLSVMSFSCPVIFSLCPLHVPCMSLSLPVISLHLPSSPFVSSNFLVHCFIPPSLSFLSP